MKREITIKYLLVCLATFFYTSYCLGQYDGETELSDNNYIPPRMWVDKFRSIQRVTAFGAKHYLISQATRTDQTISMYYKDFFKMIKYFEDSYPTQYKYLKVSIAMYSKEGSLKVPVGWGKKLTLLFEPLRADWTPIKCFSLRPDQEFDANIDEINFPLRDKWTTRYLSLAMPHMLTTIDENEAENQYKDLLSETRYLWYDRNDVQEVREYLATLSYANLDTDGVRAFFAAYTEKGNEDEGGKYKKRLHVQYEFVDTTGEVLYLEDILSKASTSETKKLKIIEEIKGLNNGHLCPANCP